MALKDIFTMIKADRYTADGKDELNKALEADVKDKTYQVGEISQKTGLQKQGDGSWAPPKNAKGKSGNAALKTFNKMTGSNKSDLESVKKDYDKALEKNTGKSAGNKNYVAIAEVIREMTPEQTQAVMNGKTYRNVKEGRGVIDITKADLEAYKQAEKTNAGVNKNLANMEQARKIQAGVEKYLASKPAADSAPRALTGDCKVRVKK